MRTIEDWDILAELGIPVVGLECSPSDRAFIFAAFQQKAIERDLPLYYWNTGYAALQGVEVEGKQYRLSPTELIPKDGDILQWLLEDERTGIFLLDDLTDFTQLEARERSRLESQIQNVGDRYRFSPTPCYSVLMGAYLQFGSKLEGLEILKYALPDAKEVRAIVETFCQQQALQSDSPESRQRLAVACQGLARGAISLALQRYAPLTPHLDTLSEAMLEYKTNRLRGLGLEFIAEPDVPTAGGLDLLQRFLTEKVVKLNEPSARQYGLRPPRGMLLLGPPGTGKTLSAKLAAKALGYSLLALSWGNVLGSDNPDRTLAGILATADALDKVILLADDFDKGFTGWETGGASRRLSQRLLTWMQEHDSDAMLVATVNRIQLLPAELKRRFDDGGIWFVDLPQMGAMYEIFRVHLQKYFPTQFGEGREPWGDREWYRLLKAYRGATPVEIARAVERCAVDFYCGLGEEERMRGNVEARIEIEALHGQLNEFVMASKRDAEELQAIRNKAYYCRAASSPERS
ncbi:ATP-binding protein, partial [Spirulina sp. 06S082]|uniref:ATP-binding protein n=1 Tax=Spirulina sp. 06S082 TaxID=3110248 RepID=UPI002B20CB1E